jgi:hypothetical protein
MGPIRQGYLWTLCRGVELFLGDEKGRKRWSLLLLHELGGQEIVGIGTIWGSWRQMDVNERKKIGGIRAVSCTRNRVARVRRTARDPKVGDHGERCQIVNAFERK